MKVRCIDGSWTSNELTTGKEYEVLSEVGCYYQLKTNDKGIRYQCYVKSRFEVINEDNKTEELSEDERDFVQEIIDECLKEKNKIEKTFREVIADIKEGEVWESAQNCFQLKEISCIEGRIKFKLEGVFVEKTDNLNNVDTGEGSGQTFKLQRKQCTFEEAFKAYEKGIKVESQYSGISYEKKNKSQVEVSCDNNASLESEFNISFSTGEIRDKWYINN